MAKVMTNEQIKAFEDLIETKGTWFKGQLRKILYFNSTDPKFKKGDCFIVTDRGHSVYGHPVRNVNAMVVDIGGSLMGEAEFRYELEAVITCGDKETAVKIYKDESDLVGAERCNDNKTRFGNPLGKYPESLSI